MIGRSNFLAANVAETAGRMFWSGLQILGKCHWKTELAHTALNTFFGNMWLVKMLVTNIILYQSWLQPCSFCQNTILKLHHHINTKCIATSVVMRIFQLADSSIIAHILCNGGNSCWREWELVFCFHRFVRHFVVTVISLCSLCAEVNKTGCHALLRLINMTCSLFCTGFNVFP